MDQMRETRVKISSELVGNDVQRGVNHYWDYESMQIIKVQILHKKKKLRLIGSSHLGPLLWVGNSVP